MEEHWDGGTLGWRNTGMEEHSEAVTHLQLLLQFAAALLAAVELLLGGRGLVSDLLQLLKKLRRSGRLTTREKKEQLLLELLVLLHPTESHLQLPKPLGQVTHLPRGNCSRLPDSTEIHLGNSKVAKVIDV
ncbi:hypothetical protein EYF80_042412 [Liparis tanakae]|uniref:Uncharacterized protein n=1 Tax=Liparis tanakae TaxID=230148 RepID=A0A4Z2G1K5_9TELE|nr:hypothetical protein EYF80_042412 [Liparis tanakae]